MTTTQADDYLLHMTVKSMAADFAGVDFGQFHPDPTTHASRIRSRMIEAEIEAQKAGLPGRVRLLDDLGSVFYRADPQAQLLKIVHQVVDGDYQD